MRIVCASPAVAVKSPPIVVVVGNTLHCRSRIIRNAAAAARSEAHDKCAVVLASTPSFHAAIGTRVCRALRTLFLVLTCSTSCLADSPPERLRKSAPVGLTRTDRGHEASLTFYEPQGLLNLSVKPLNKAAPVAPMKERIELWKPLIEEFFREHGRREEYLLGVGEYPELETRLADAAVDSGKWNLRTGKPKMGSAERVVRDLLVDERLFAELKTLWAPFGYEVSVRSVEKVLVRRWREFAPHEGKTRRPPDARLPFGAAILFHLKSERKEP